MEVQIEWELNFDQNFKTLKYKSLAFNFSPSKHVLTFWKPQHSHSTVAELIEDR